MCNKIRKRIKMDCCANQVQSLPVSLASFSLAKLRYCQAKPFNILLNDRFLCHLDFNTIKVFNFFSFDYIKNFIYKLHYIIL